MLPVSGLLWHRDPTLGLHKEQRNSGPLRILESLELGAVLNLRILFILRSLGSPRF